MTTMTASDPRLRIKRLVLERDDVNHVIALEDGLLILDDFSEKRPGPRREPIIGTEHTPITAAPA